MQDTTQTNDDLKTEHHEHDFSDVQSAEEAFEKLSEIVKTMARQNGHDEDLETVAWDNEKTREKRSYPEDDLRNIYTVGYEAGPSQWAVRMLGGQEITVFNLDDDTFHKHKLVGVDEGNFEIECQFSFELHIYEVNA